MGRSVQFSSEAVWYTPDIEGNRNDPDPFQVLITPMSAKESLEMERSARKEFAGESDPWAGVQLTHAKIVRERVLEVRNYSVTELKTGRVVTPKNGAELVEAIYGAGASETPIIVDIVQAIERRSKLEEGLSGKYDSRPASPPAVTATRGLGAAPGAKAIPRVTGSASPAIATGSPQPSASNGHPSSTDALGVS